MGELYQKAERDLAIKNLAVGTREQYLRCCSLFAAYHMVSPREMGLKFLYGVTLDREEVARKIPWPKVPHKKPDILSLSEVERLLEAALSASLAPAVVSITAYGAGLRIAEACRLQPTDIISSRMLIHVRQGKGNKDRYVMLSPRLLEILRGYWVKARPTGDWLFPGRKTPFRKMTFQAPFL